MKTDSKLKQQVRNAVRRGRSVEQAVHDITLSALTRRSLDRTAMRKVADEVMTNVRDAADVKGARAKDVVAEAAAGVNQALAHAARALKVSRRVTAGVDAAAASGAMVARIAAGVLAGIADGLSRGRRGRASADAARARRHGARPRPPAGDRRRPDPLRLRRRRAAPGPGGRARACGQGAALDAGGGARAPRAARARAPRAAGPRPDVRQARPDARHARRPVRAGVDRRVREAAGPARRRRPMPRCARSSSRISARAPEEVFAGLRPGAGRGRLDRAGAPCAPRRRHRGRGQGAPPRHRRGGRGGPAPAGAPRRAWSRRVVRTCALPAARGGARSSPAPCARELDLAAECRNAERVAAKLCATTPASWCRRFTGNGPASA